MICHLLESMAELTNQMELSQSWQELVACCACLSACRMMTWQKTRVAAELALRLSQPEYQSTADPTGRASKSNLVMCFVSNTLPVLLLGRETLYEDDVPEEEVEAELAPLNSQLAYVASRLGRSEEASTSYQDLLNKHQADENVLAVVQNNFLALQSGTQSHQKRFAGEALKKFEGLMNSEHPGQLQPGVEARLSEQQKQALHTNHALLLLLTNKSEACQLKLDLLKTRSALRQASATCKTRSHTMFTTTWPAADMGISMSAVPCAVQKQCSLELSAPLFMCILAYISFCMMLKTPSCSCCRALPKAPTHSIAI